LHKLANYIINNFNELTTYITNAYLSLDNNISERFLRYEKVMLASSKFRANRTGRVAYDILRTIISTCNAVEINFQEYLIFIMQNKDNIVEEPEKFTPIEYAKNFLQ